MAAVNKAILIGNVGRDPETKYTQSGMAVCSLRLATSFKRKDKSTGEMVEETEWHSVVLYDRLAEIAGQYLKKGRPAYIEGHLKTRKWSDKDGVERQTTEIVAESLQLLGGREDGAGGGGGGAPAPRAPRPAPAPAGRSSGGGAPKSSTGFDDMEDDIPF